MILANMSFIIKAENLGEKLEKIEKFIKDEFDAETVDCMTTGELGAFLDALPDENIHEFGSICANWIEDNFDEEPFLKKGNYKKDILWMKNVDNPKKMADRLLINHPYFEDFCIIQKMFDELLDTI